MIGRMEFRLFLNLRSPELPKKQCLHILQNLSCHKRNHPNRSSQFGWFVLCIQLLVQKLDGLLVITDIDLSIQNILDVCAHVVKIVGHLAIVQQ